MHLGEYKSDIYSYDKQHVLRNRESGFNAEHSSYFDANILLTFDVWLRETTERFVYFVRKIQYVCKNEKIVLKKVDPKIRRVICERFPRQERV